MKNGCRTRQCQNKEVNTSMSHNNSKQLAFILFVLFIEQILEYDYKFEAYNKPNCFSRFAYRLEFESYVFLLFVI